MRVLLILAAISFSAAAFAQSAPPKVGNKPLVRVNGPNNLTRFKRPKEAVCGDWPDSQENGVGIESLGVKLVSRQQHQKQQHDNFFVSSHEMT